MTEAEFKEKRGLWDPMPELTITSPYVHSRVDSNTFTMGNAMPESTLTLCQSRLYHFGFGLWSDSRSWQQPILGLTTERVTKFDSRMRSSLVVRRLTANAPVATVLGSIPSSVGTVESEGRQMKQFEYSLKKKSPQKLFRTKKSTHTHSNISDTGHNKSS
jgi:hypothetical protein